MGYIELPADQLDSISRFGLPPGVLDAALQTILGFVPRSPQGRRWPGAAARGSIASSCIGRSNRRSMCTSEYFLPTRPEWGRAEVFDVSIVNEAGLVLVKLEGLTIRQVPSPRLPATTESAAGNGPADPESDAVLAFLRPHWEPRAADFPTSDPESGRPILIVRGPNDFGLSALHRRGPCAGTNTRSHGRDTFPDNRGRPLGN